MRSGIISEDFHASLRQNGDQPFVHRWNLILPADCGIHVESLLLFAGQTGGLMFMDALLWMKQILGEILFYELAKVP